MSQPGVGSWLSVSITTTWAPSDGLALLVARGGDSFEALRYQSLSFLLDLIRDECASCLVGLSDGILRGCRGCAVFDSAAVALIPGCIGGRESTWSTTRLRPFSLLARLDLA